jgi:hypothetical protein
MNTQHETMRVVCELFDVEKRADDETKRRIESRTTAPRDALNRHDQERADVATTAPLVLLWGLFVCRRVVSGKFR